MISSKEEGLKFILTYITDFKTSYRTTRQGGISVSRDLQIKREYRIQKYTDMYTANLIFGGGNKTTPWGKTELEQLEIHLGKNGPWPFPHAIHESYLETDHRHKYRN